MTNPVEALRQAYEAQSRMRAALKAIRVEAEAGGGLVRVVTDGEHQVLELVIDPALLARGDARFVADLVKAALNDARRRAGDEAKRAVEQAMAQVLANRPTT